MKKRVFGVALVLLFVLPIAFASADEIEIGVGLSPPMADEEELQGDDFWANSIKSFHFGYSFWWLLYGSVDSLVLPPYTVKDLTSFYNEETGIYVEGYYRPGFMNLFDVGIRPRIGPIILKAAIGVNTLYVYKQAELEAEGEELNTDFGTNMRLGAGLALGKHWNVMLGGTAVFASFEDIETTMRALAGDDEWLRTKTIDRIKNSLYPSLTFNVVF